MGVGQHELDLAQGVLVAGLLAQGELPRADRAPVHLGHRHEALAARQLHLVARRRHRRRVAAQQRQLVLHRDAVGHVPVGIEHQVLEGAREHRGAAVGAPHDHVHLQHRLTLLHHLQVEIGDIHQDIGRRYLPRQPAPALQVGVQLVYPGKPVGVEYLQAGRPHQAVGLQAGVALEFLDRLQQLGVVIARVGPGAVQAQLQLPHPLAAVARAQQRPGGHRLGEDIGLGRQLCPFRQQRLVLRVLRPQRLQGLAHVTGFGQQVAGEGRRIQLLALEKPVLVQGADHAAVAVAGLGQQGVGVQQVQLRRRQGSRRQGVVVVAPGREAVGGGRLDLGQQRGPLGGQGAVLEPQGPVLVCAVQLHQRGGVGNRVGRGQPAGLPQHFHLATQFVAGGGQQQPRQQQGQQQRQENERARSTSRVELHHGGEFTTGGWGKGGPASHMSNVPGDGLVE